SASQEFLTYHRSALARTLSVIQSQGYAKAADLARLKEGMKALKERIVQAQKLEREEAELNSEECVLERKARELHQGGGIAPTAEEAERRTRESDTELSALRAKAQPLQADRIAKLKAYIDLLNVHLFSAMEKGEEELDPLRAKKLYKVTDEDQPSSAASNGTVIEEV